MCGLKKKAIASIECTILILSGTALRSLENSRIGGESTSGKNGPIRIEDEDVSAALKLTTI